MYTAKYFHKDTKEWRDHKHMDMRQINVIKENDMSMRQKVETKKNSVNANLINKHLPHVLLRGMRNTLQCAKVNTPILQTHTNIDSGSTDTAR